jgi:hypothetical protein
MNRINKIKNSLDASSNFLISLQNQDGSWNDPEPEEITRDSLYKQPIVTTSQAIRALLFNLKPEYTSKIQKAVTYCSAVNTENISDLGVLAWKLTALNYASTDIHNLTKNKILTHLINKQEQRGFWMTYPSTNYIVNYNVLEGLKNQEIPNKTKINFINWMESTRSKDGGWGFNPEDNKEYITATTASIFSLLNAGKQSSSDYFIASREFIESRQFEDGHWIAKFDDGHRNAEATAAAALILMIISEDPFNQRVEKAIDYLLSIQNLKGHYSRESIHSIRYVTHLFSFYLFLKESLNSTEAEFLKSKIKNKQDITNFYYRKFEVDLRSRLILMNYQAVLTSKVLGTTHRAVTRRIEIINILNKNNSLATADIIDKLQELKEYKYLKKKTHLTQIKSDVEYLKDIKLIYELNGEYILGFKI